MHLNLNGRSFFIQLEKAIYCMEMLASPGCDPALRGQPVKAAAGASLEVALTGWERVLPHRKNDWPFINQSQKIWKKTKKKYVRTKSFT
jgi:hypothetical protein